MRAACRVEVSLFGGVGIAVDTAPRPISGIKQRILVAALALSPGRALGADRLIDLLWGEQPPRTARRSLQAHVSKIRAATSPAELIATVGTGYVMDVERQAVDMLAWHDESLTALELVADDPHAAARLLTDLEHRWAEPLGGHDETDELAAMLAPFRALLIQVREGAVTAQIDAGDSRSAVRTLEDLTRTSPTTESLWLQLARGYTALDRRHDALDAIQRAREALREELGVDLGPRLAKFEVRVLDGMDETGGGGPDQAAPLLRRDNLRPEPNTLIDRSEVERVQALLGPSRVATLVGPGGIGKSRCARAVARRCINAEMWPDGVWFVDLTTVDAALDASTGDIAGAVAGAIGLGRADAVTTAETIADYLGPRRVLLVLDNCEHVSEAVRLFVRDLFARVTGTAILATSRVRLALAEEQTLSIETMSSAAAQQLFIARVVEMGAGPFPVDDIAELCAELDHYPLALELAAARTRTITPGEIVARLRRQPSFVHGSALSGRSPESRHQSLSLALDWSLAQLGPGERTVLDRAAVFAGDFNIDAAEAVVSATNTDELTSDGPATGETVLDALGVLVEHHLVERDHQRARFHILEPIRQTLIAQAPVRPDVHVRHAEFYCAEARRITEGIFTEREALHWDRMHAERSQIGDAIRWAATHGEVELVETAMQRMAQVVSLAVYTEPGEWADAALASLGANPSELPWTSLTAAAGLAQTPRLDECDALLDALDPTLDDPWMRATMYAVRVQRDQANAHRWIDDLHASATEANDPILLALAHMRGHDPDAVAFADRIGHPSSRTLARIYEFVMLDDSDKRSRVDLIEEIYRIALASGCSYTITQGLIYQSIIHCRTGQVRAGVEYAVEAIERSARLRSPHQVWHIVEFVANVLGFMDSQPETSVALWAAVDTIEHPPLSRVYRNPAAMSTIEDMLDADQIRRAHRYGAGLTMDQAVTVGRKAIEQLGEAG